MTNNKKDPTGIECDGRFSRSAELYEQARKYMPGGVSSHFRLGMKPCPLFFARAEGSKLYDQDGNTYIDYALGMGPVLLGHAHPAVNAAVRSSLPDGQLYAGQHKTEMELARQICEVVPCAEMVRFSMSGTEAVQAALRVARAFTKRSRIVKFEGHYHGWLDNVYVSVHPTDPLRGPEEAPQAVPESLGQDAPAYRTQVVLPWNNLEVLRARLESDRDIAAVVMEPIMCNTAVILPRPGYLEAVRELCTRHAVLLIFDEVITGFRVALGGAQAHLGVTPDLAVFAKAIGNGYPISCLAGRADVMALFGTSTVVHGGTYNANTISCAAALAVVKHLRASETAVYARLRDIGTELQEGLRKLAAETRIPLLVQGLPTVFHTTFTRQSDISDYRAHQQCDNGEQDRLVYGLLLRGVRVTGRGTWFLSTAHTPQDVRDTLDATRDVLRHIAAPTITNLP